MTTDMTKISASAILDILSFFGIPTSSIQELWNAHCERKLAESRDILFDEINQGNFNNIANDDKISLIHRYTLAAMNGTARLNLRLLAKAINSITKGEQLPSPIYANEFNRYAQILETLSDDEIHLLANMYQYKKDAPQSNITISSHEINYNNYFIQNFAKHYRYKYKKSDGEYKALCCALLRTGLIYQIPTIRDTTYDLSPFFDKIIELVDFQDALDKETKQQESPEN
jgi:hypothetical protein